LKDSGRLTSALIWQVERGYLIINNSPTGDDMGFADIERAAGSATGFR